MNISNKKWPSDFTPQEEDKIRTASCELLFAAPLEISLTFDPGKA